MVKKISAIFAVVVLVAFSGFVAWSVSTGRFNLVDAAIDPSIPTPIVQTGDATDRTSSSAVIRGAYRNPGNDGHVWFEYGPDPDPKKWGNLSKAGVQGMPPGSSGDKAFTLGNLLPNTTYYYYIVADNGGGNRRGDLKSFTTPADGSPTCNPDPLKDMDYEIFYQTQGATSASAIIKNKSSDCTFKVGMASYKTYEKNQILDQTLFDSQTAVIGPGQSVNLNVKVPACEAQIDLFQGDVLIPPTYQNYQLFAGPWVNSNMGSCKDTPIEPATLKLVKTVKNDNGGTKQVSDFKLFQNGVEVTSGVDKTYTFGHINDTVQVTATENNLPGYTAGNWGGDCAADGKVTLRSGDHKTCTITNDDVPPAVIPPATLKLVKTVTNDNGGTKQVSDFKLFMDSTQVASGEVKTFNFSNANDSKTIVVSEQNLAGYTAGSWGTDCSAYFLPGDANKDGTVNQTDRDILNATYNKNQGDAGYDSRADFNGDNKVDFADMTLLAQNFNSSSSGNGKIVLKPGDNKICTINNNDIPPAPVPPATLKLVKTVVNNNGGTKQASDFKLFMDATQVASGEVKTFTFANTNDTKTVIASEMNLAGYTAGTWGGSCVAYFPSGDANKDGNVNQLDRDILTATYNKNKGDSGYDARADFNGDDKVDFNDLVILGQNFNTQTSSTAALADLGDANLDGVVNQADRDILAATYNKNQGDAGYDTRADFNNDNKVDFADMVILAQNFNTSVPAASFNGNGKVVLRPGDNLICTITNDDNAPHTASLTLVKKVINDNGGNKTVADFKLFQNGVEVNSGQSKTYSFNNANDSIVIAATENNLPGYSASSWGGDCAADGKITLKPGEHKTCEITNNDVPPTPLKGCIAINKETYTWNDVRITPTQAFSFKIDNNQTVTTDANGNAVINDVPVGTHTVEEIVPSGWVLHSITPALNNGAITVGAGSGCATVKFVNKTVQPNLSGVCIANKNPAFVSETITYTASPSGGNGQYTYEWSGDDGLTGNATTTQKAYSTTGTKNARVKISSNGQHVFADCNTVIQTAGGGGSDFAIACVANLSSAFIGNPVIFTANPTGGTGSYTYQWGGDIDPALVTATKSVTYNFNSIGTKNVQVTVTSGGQTLSAHCPVNIVQPTLCGNCGGGGGGSNPTPTTVTVNSVTNPGQVAGVFLSQVPYTGIGSNLKVALFMLALFSWSAWISYLIIKRKAKKNGMTVAEIFQGPATGPTLAFAGGPMPTAQNPLAGRFTAQVKPQPSIPVMQNVPRADINAVPHEPKPVEKRTFVKSPFLDHLEETPIEQTPVTPVQKEATPSVNVPTDNTYDKLFNRVNEPAPREQSAAPSRYEPAMALRKTDNNMMPQVAKQQAQIAIPSSTEDVMESLEMHARQLQTLVSADGLEIIAKASQNNKHNAVIILSHLVELYKGTEHEVDGDWMVLNGEKINKILFSTYITMTPVFIQWLADGDDKKTMAFIRMLQMQGQTIKDFIMNIVIELDKAYRYRIENVGEADAAILDSTMQWSNQELESVIHTLVTAVDQTYSSVYSSVKIALVKVLDMSKSKFYA